MATLTAVEFAILGPLEVRDGGRVLVLRQGRPRALLAALVVRLGKVASADVLVEEIWGEQPLTNAANALQVQVSYLRRTLGLGSGPGQPALRTVGGGYLLDVDPDSVDAYRFARLVRSAAGAAGGAVAGRRHAARDELHAALELWRGTPLQDVPDDAFAGPRSPGSRSCGPSPSSTRSTPGWHSASTSSPPRRCAS